MGRLALPYNNLLGWHSLITTCSNGGSAGTPLIGYERWHCLHRGEPKVLDAFYATPHPSIHVPPLPLPDGPWHMVWSHRLLRKWQEWIDSPLVEEETLHLKKEAALALKAITTLRARARAISQACEWLRASRPEASPICLVYVYSLSPLGRAFASQHKRRVPK